jgi:uncharacterized protein YjiS (DUF1127 family)
LSNKHELTFRTLSPQEIDEIVRDAQRIRARAVAEVFSYLGRFLRKGGVWLWSGVKALFAVMAEAREARELYERLSQMSDHQLADIGLTRTDIPAVVAGTFRRPEAEPDNIREEADDVPELEYKEAA